MADSLSPTEIKKRIEEDADFVNLRRFEYSLEKTMAKYRDRGGCPDHIIAKGMGMSEEQLQMMYQRIIRKLRKGMGVDIDTGEED